MVLKLYVSGSTFNGGGTAVSVSHGSDAEIKFIDNRLNDGANGIVERDSLSLLMGLGLPENTPVDTILEVIKALRDASEVSNDEKVEVIKSSKIWAYVERSADAMTVIQGIIAIAGVAIGAPAAF